MKKKRWYLSTIDDPNFISGKSIIQVIKAVKIISAAEYVVLDYIDGISESDEMGKLIGLQNKPIELNHFLETIVGVKQFFWGDFFLFKEYPTHWNNPEGTLYPYVIAQSVSTIRAVDGQYIYIYTPHKEVVDVIKSLSNIESETFDALENLPYPE